MKHVICPICNSVCVRNGKNKSGSQRWLCPSCKITFTPKIDNSAKQLQIFLNWLFSKDSQKTMPGEGRTFRRNTSQFWDIWPLPPRVEERRDVLYVDGIYLGRKACVLICCDKEYVLGWYLCRYEHARAYISLLSRIAEPSIVISDGGTGFKKAMKKIWPHAEIQRCVFHVFCQVKRYTTSRPNTAAGVELYALAKDLLHVESASETSKWVDKFLEWMSKYNKFLSQMTYDENGNSRPTHERLIKAQRSIMRLLNEGTLFTYLDDSLVEELGKIPATNNQIEGGVNSRLRAMLRDHRGLSVERRIKAVFWWCYMHSPEPLSVSEILNTMPTDKSINEIYSRMTRQEKLSGIIPDWGDAIVWSELHHSGEYPNSWD
ncbi:MAG: IS1249 family transposase [Bacillota bacterium]|nr:IS1249 family transposase [Bacillota bacterium]